MGRQDSQNGAGSDGPAPSSPAPRPDAAQVAVPAAQLAPAPPPSPGKGVARVPVAAPLPAAPVSAGVASVPPVSPAPDQGPAVAPGIGRASVAAPAARPAEPAAESDLRQLPAAQPGGPAPGVTDAEAGATAAQPGTAAGGRIGAVVVSAVVVLLAVAAVLAVVKPGPVKGWLAFTEPGAATPAPAAPTADPQPTPVLRAAGADAPLPTPAGVAAAVAPLLKAKALGASVGVSIVDVATGQALFAQQGDSPATPASTTKLLTAVTVLAARGPAYRLTTRVVAGATPGEVVLIGGGDPTMAVGAKGQFPGAARLDKLAALVRKTLGATKPTRVVIDTSLFSGPATGKGWSSGLIAPEGQVAAIQPLMTNAGRIQPVHHEVGADPRFGDPALAAGRVFAKQLGVPAGAVSRGQAPVAASPAPTGTAPGAELGRVQSPPLVQVVDWMLQQSDNVIAEAMGRQVALAAGRPASFDGAADAMVAKLTALGLPGDEANLYDASGLSRHNGISPTLLTDLLALAAGGSRPELTGLFAGLPVAGWSGTLAGRFTTPADNRVGQGVVRAKTGSLDGVTTMAGELITQDGRVLVFALLADRAGEPTAARQALDRIAARLIRCGC